MNPQWSHDGTLLITVPADIDGQRCEVRLTFTERHQRQLLAVLQTKPPTLAEEAAVRVSGKIDPAWGRA